ncbi:MAG: hypothetical protein QOG58_4620 [Caballeronia sp.]|nr:hypothetical protein [Caballeronia sp.]
MLSYGLVTATAAVNKIVGIYRTKQSNCYTAFQMYGSCMPKVRTLLLFSKRAASFTALKCRRITVALGFASRFSTDTNLTLPPGFP